MVTPYVGGPRGLAPNAVQGLRLPIKVRHQSRPWRSLGRARAQDRSIPLESEHKHITIAEMVTVSSAVRRAAFATRLVVRAINGMTCRWILAGGVSHTRSNSPRSLGLLESRHWQ